MADSYLRARQEILSDEAGKIAIAIECGIGRRRLPVSSAVETCELRAMCPHADPFTLLLATTFKWWSKEKNDLPAGLRPAFWAVASECCDPKQRRGKPAEAGCEHLHYCPKQLHELISNSAHA